jgi:hypothetical protein
MRFRPPRLDKVGELQYFELSYFELSSDDLDLSQPYPRDVIAHCARVAWSYPSHHCTQCDPFLYDIELACQANGGRLPGPLTIFGDRPYDNGPTWQDHAAQ